MTGKQFEEHFISNLRRWKGIKPATQAQDVKEGTDFLYYGVRVDVTINDNKDNTQGHFHYRFNGFDVNASVRTGNRHTTFDEPVLVLHFSSLELQGVLNTTIDYGPEILEEALDFYWNSIE